MSTLVKVSLVKLVQGKQCSTSFLRWAPYTYTLAEWCEILGTILAEFLIWASSQIAFCDRGWKKEDMREDYPFLEAELRDCSSKRQRGMLCFLWLQKYLLKARIISNARREGAALLCLGQKAFCRSDHVTVLQNKLVAFNSYKKEGVFQ